MSAFNLTQGSSLFRGNKDSVDKHSHGGQTPYQRDSFASPSPSLGMSGISWGWPGGSSPTPKPSLTSPSPSPQTQSQFGFGGIHSLAQTQSTGNVISNFANSLRAAPTPQPPKEFKPAPVVRTTQTKAPTSNKSSTPSQGLAPTLPARYIDPNIDRIAAAIHDVNLYKTPSALFSSCVFLVIGLLLLVLCFKVPMASRVWIFSRLTVQLVGVLVGSVFAFVGINGIHRYRSLQVPAQALEGLTERQKALMGWTTGNSIGPVDPSMQRSESDRTPGAALRRRREQSQPSSPQPPMSGRGSSGSSNTTASSRSDGANARHNLSPIPTASLRFLDPSGSARSPTSFASRLHNPSLGSPFRTRGLDVHHVQDAADLQELVSNRSLRDERFGNANAALLTPPSATSAAARYGAANLSPRGGGAGYGSVSYLSPTSAGSSAYQNTPYTPPYATSVREVLATPVVVAASTSTSSTQPFVYPGLRHLLEDPRSDFELHDLFGQTLSTVRKSTQDFDQSVRRMRAWLVSTILRPFLRYMEHTTLAMSNAAQRLLANHQMTTQFTREELTLFRELSTLATEVQRGHQVFQTTARIEEAIALIRARYPKNAEGLARRGVEMILSCVPPGASSKVTPQTKEYVAKRLMHLCAPGDDSLSKYSVNLVGATPSAPQSNTGLFGAASSGLFGQTRSSVASPASGPVSSFPSDAQIIMHAFCAHMETVAPGFALQYVRDAADGTPTGVSCLPRTNEPCIVQVRPAQLAPYFVVAKASATTASTTAASSSSRSQCPVKYLTEPGRPSLFQALTLWVHELPANSRLGREFTGIIESN